MNLSNKSEKVEGGFVVLDFGSQLTQLIARRLRELNVYSELLPFNAPIEKIRALNDASFDLAEQHFSKACELDPGLAAGHLYMIALRGSPDDDARPYPVRNLYYRRQLPLLCTSGSAGAVHSAGGHHAGCTSGTR